jgi:hypothetical protein
MGKFTLGASIIMTFLASKPIALSQQAGYHCSHALSRLRKARKTVEELGILLAKVSTALTTCTILTPPINISQSLDPGQYVAVIALKLQFLSRHCFKDVLTFRLVFPFVPLSSHGILLLSFC